jgi:hypothetical protein
MEIFEKIIMNQLDAMSISYKSLFWNAEPGVTGGRLGGLEPHTFFTLNVAERPRTSSLFLATVLRFLWRFFWTSDMLLLKKNSSLRMIWAMGKGRSFKSRCWRVFPVALITTRCWWEKVPSGFFP